MAILENAAFKEAYKKHINELPGTIKNKNIVSEREKLAKLIETELDGLADFLKGLYESADYTLAGPSKSLYTRLRVIGKPDGHKLLGKALDEDARMDLVGFFAASVSYFLYFWLNKNETEKGRAYNKVAAETKGDWDGVAANTLAKHAIAQRLQFFKDNIQTTCRRICDDWGDINELFFEEKVLVQLTKLRTTGSDYHKKGKQVLILTFEACAVPPADNMRRGALAPGRLGKIVKPTTSFVRLIYKPSDVEPDMRMVGDTDFMKVQLPHLFTAEEKNAERKLNAFDSLFCMINKKIRDIHDAEESQEAMLQLPVYNILPRNCGSLLKEAGGALPIADSYGYIEFLTCNPEPEEGGQINLDEDHPETWDYVARDIGTGAGKFDVTNYYRIYGWYCGLGLVLNFGDQHNENIIVHNKRPHLIDLEIMFKHRANEIEATMLQYSMEKQNRTENKDVFMCKSGGAIKHTMGAPASARIRAGFLECLKWLKDNGQVVKDWLENGTMKDVVVRYTPRATKAFSANMRSCFSPTVCLNPVPDVNKPEDFTDPPYKWFHNEDIWQWFFNGGVGYRGRPLHAISAPKHDYACYLNCDAPAYYRRIGALDLLNGRGEKVVVPDLKTPDDTDLIMSRSDGYGYDAQILAPCEGDEEFVRFKAFTGGQAGRKVSVELKNGEGDELTVTVETIGAKEIPCEGGKSKVLLIPKKDEEAPNIKVSVNPAPEGPRSFTINGFQEDPDFKAVVVFGSEGAPGAQRIEYLFNHHLEICKKITAELVLHPDDQTPKIQTLAETALTPVTEYRVKVKFGAQPPTGEEVAAALKAHPKASKLVVASFDNYPTNYPNEDKYEGKTKLKEMDATKLTAPFPDLAHKGAEFFKYDPEGFHAGDAKNAIDIALARLADVMADADTEQNKNTGEKLQNIINKGFGDKILTYAGKSTHWDKSVDF